MVYQVGGVIDNDDYNAIVAQINTLFGIGNGSFGYGGNSVSIPVSGNLSTIPGNPLIQNENWIILRNAIFDMATHQGTTLPESLPNLTVLEDGDIIFSHDDRAPTNPLGELNSASNFSTLTTNRLNINVINATLSNRLVSTRNTGWTSLIQHVFTVTFSSGDHARYFFNTGGQIQISASRTGGTNKLQNTAWTNMLAAYSPFIFTQSHYYALTTSPVLLRTVNGASTSPSPYFVANHWDIYANSNALNVSGNNDRGNILTFYSQFYDPFIVASGQPADGVDGVFTSTVSELKSSVIFNIVAPSYSTITPL